MKVLLKFMFQLLFSLLCAKLLCRYERKSVLRFLETFENYRVERCLHLCREHGIVDTASFLLERVGELEVSFCLLYLRLMKNSSCLILPLKVNTVMRLPSISKLFFKQERGH